MYPVGNKKPRDIIPGTEGVGEVLSVGSSVKGLTTGDWVVPAKFNFGTRPTASFIIYSFTNVTTLFLIKKKGTWRTHAVVGQKDILKVRQNIKPEYISTISVTPCTAYRLLHDFVNLKEGDVVIQNGANSAVGQAVNQLAKLKGIKTINIIRDRVNWDECVERMKAYGAYMVIDYEMVRKRDFKALIGDLPPPKLALNCIGKYLHM